MASNLPPGVSVSMIPGNRPEDIEDEAFWETLDAKLIENGIDLPEFTDELTKVVDVARGLAYERGYADGRNDEALVRFEEEQAAVEKEGVAT